MTPPFTLPKPRRISTLTVATLLLTSALFTPPAHTQPQTTTTTNPAPTPAKPVTPIGYNLNTDGTLDTTHPITNTHLTNPPNTTTTPPSIGTLPILDNPAEEKIIGEDNRTQVTNTTETPFRWLGRITFTSPYGLTARCTGALISPDTVLTAGHCLARGGSNFAFTPGKNADQSPFGTVKATQIWYDQNFGTPGHDWGIIKLDTPIGTKIGWFGMHKPHPTTLHNQHATIIGYPGDKPTDTLWKDRNKVAKVDGPQVYYTTDTFGGQSGSPVLQDDATIYAIHTSGLGQQNWGTLLTGDVFNVAVNLSQHNQ